MAAIEQLPSGLWRARIRRQGYQSVSKSFRLKADAEGWARKVESEQERAVWHDGSEAERMTLREALDRYEREVTPRKRAQASERSNLRALRDEPAAALALARIRSREVAQMRDAWARAGLKPASIKRRMVTLSHVFTVAAIEWGMPGLKNNNPVREVRLAPEDNERARRVSDEEIDAICAATESAELAAYVRLAVETAMRRGELCKLRWEHVDLAAGEAYLPRPVTKNRHARAVPLTPTTVALLQSLPRRSDGRVMGLRPDSVTQAFERARDRVGLTDLTFHDLRHEATSRLAEKLEAHELAAWTGHREMKMVLRYYHPRAADLARKAAGPARKAEKAD